MFRSTIYKRLQLLDTWTVRRHSCSEKFEAQENETYPQSRDLHTIDQQQGISELL